MANRVFYAVKAIGISEESTNDYTEVHGLTTADLTTNFDLEQAFEIGQLDIYENIENIPDVELSLEKNIDGYPLIYHLATQGSSDDTLVGRSKASCGATASIFGETQNSASGTPVAQVVMSGLFSSSLNYTLPVEGNCTEAVTLVGFHKLWRSSDFTFSGGFDNQDEPLALTSGLGGIQRRENVVFDTGTANYTKLPSEIPGISSSGTNDKTGGQFGCHVQSITVSTDLSRTELSELGRKAPYYRYVDFPVEVTCDIEVLTTEGDKISATEDGVAGSGDNLTHQQIRIKLEDSTLFDLGSKNKLSSVSQTGGGTDGGNETTTYSYSNWNYLTISQDQNPG